MNKYEITTLGRKLDLKNPNNRLIIQLATLVTISALVFYLIITKEISSSFVYGIKAGITIFLLWAIAREMDPDHESAAFIPVILTLPHVIIFGLHPIFPLIWFLLLLRLVNRSTGAKAGIIDSLAILSIGAFLTYQLSWVFGTISALGFFLDGRLSSPYRGHLIPAVLLLLYSGLALIHEITDVVMDMALLKIVAFTVMILLALPLFTNRDTIISIGDRTGERLDEQRIKATQLLAVFSVSAFMLFSTASDGFWPLVWTIPASAGLYKVLLEIKQMRT
ncbi:hypothetical protein [Methanococcoides seepicolus]|uniref:Uncharacterized protein n=1 Tax=Methanococcoides seepicolus TaxID=2828780 RepID=A0A9E4ZEJ5_9EURY|nr:hypothetical protein [Methanococcoides seepicolus]MCM1986131.1 hypothetical protein [Methanococcoides seepicolus]